MKAAFRRKTDGEIYSCATTHDLLCLPEGIDADLDTYEDGFQDEDGKFFTRDELLPVEVKKSQRGFEAQAQIWLMTSSAVGGKPLAKMAIRAEDTKAVARYHTPLGADFVDADKELTQTPAPVKPVAEAFRHHILETPETAKRGRTGTRESSNSTGKVVYDLKGVPVRNHGDKHRYMIKPYHEKISPRLKNWHNFPIMGWAEMTNQSLYHAGGIGDLHQRVHVAKVPMKDGPAPALVIHMQPQVQPVSNANLVHARGDAGIQDQGRKIALMDFLSNNLDRHGDNLLVDGVNNRLLAVDHSRSFQYKNTEKYTPPGRRELDDSLRNYIGISGLNRIIGREGRPTPPELPENMRPPKIPDWEGTLPNGQAGKWKVELIANKYGPEGKPVAHRLAFTIPSEDNPLLNSQYEYVDVPITPADPLASPPWEEHVRKHITQPFDFDAAKDWQRKAQERQRWDDIDAWNQKWTPTFDWWSKMSPAIRDAFEKRLRLLKDETVKDHLRRNFEARARQLDDYAQNGHENWGHADWEQSQVPLYKYGESDDR